MAVQLDGHMRQREAQAAAECGRELALLLAQCADRPADRQTSGRKALSLAESERLAALCRLLARLYLESDETDEAPDRYGRDRVARDTQASIQP